MRRWRILSGAFALALVPGVLAASPADDDAGLIAAAIKSGRLIQARTMLTRIAAAPATPRPVAIDALWAELALAEGRDEDALRGFDALTAAAPDNCAWLVGGGIAASRAGKADRAITSLERATKRCTIDWEAWNALGVALDAARRWEASASAYAHALALRPSSPALLNNIGMSMLRQHRFERAADYFAAALQRAPGDIRFVNNLDIARASIGRLPVRNPGEDAARWAERLGNAGQAALIAGRSDEARALLAQAIATGPIYQPATASSLALLQSRR